MSAIPGESGPITPAVVRSEIAAFLKKWDEEVEVMQRGLKGVAIVGRHDIIDHRMRAMGEQYEPQLAALMKAKQQQSEAAP